MSQAESYLSKIFEVTDPDARLRKPGELMTFLVYTATDPPPPGAAIGDFKRIPRSTRVKVDDIEVVRTGSSGSIVFGTCDVAGRCQRVRLDLDPQFCRQVRQRDAR